MKFIQVLSIVFYSLLNDKKDAQRFWSNDLVHEKAFRLSSCTPRIPFNVLSRLLNDKRKTLKDFGLHNLGPDVQSINGFFYTSSISLYKLHLLKYINKNLYINSVPYFGFRLSCLTNLHHHILCIIVYQTYSDANKIKSSYFHNLLETSHVNLVTNT